MRVTRSERLQGSSGSTRAAACRGAMTPNLVLLNRCVARVHRMERYQRPFGLIASLQSTEEGGREVEDRSIGESDGEARLRVRCAECYI